MRKFEQNLPNFRKRAAGKKYSIRKVPGVIKVKSKLGGLTIYWDGGWSILLSAQIRGRGGNKLKCLVKN